MTRQYEFYPVTTCGDRWIWRPKAQVVAGADGPAAIGSLPQVCARAWWVGCTTP